MAHVCQKAQGENVAQDAEARIQLLIQRVENGLNASDGKPMPPGAYDELVSMWRTRRRLMKTRNFGIDDACNGQQDVGG